MGKSVMVPSEEGSPSTKDHSVTLRPVSLIRIERAMPTPFKFLTRA